MGNLERVAEVIRTWQKRHEGIMDRNPEWAAQNLAIDLLMGNVLAPELPEPNDPGIFVPDGKGWSPEGPYDPLVWTAPTSRIIVQRIEPGDLTPDEARDVAYALLAAANYSEEI